MPHAAFLLVVAMGPDAAPPGFSYTDRDAANRVEARRTHDSLQSDPLSRCLMVESQLDRVGLLRRFFWLDDQLAAFDSAGWSIAQTGLPELEVARHARDGAARLGNRGSHCLAVIVLLRTELLLVMQALMKQSGIDGSGGSLGEDDWKVAERVDAIRDMLSSLNHRDHLALKACLARGGELSLGGLGAKSLQQVVHSLRQARRLLRESLGGDDQQVARLKIQRWTRVGAAACVVLCLLGTTGASYASHRRGPNIALYRPTRGSSNFPSEFFHVHKVSDASQLVNGKRGSTGCHTQLEANPFVTIDLGAPQSFNQVVVYNRNDCCAERAVPLAIEVSDDDTNYRMIAEQRKVFLIWTAKNLHAKGRYVRLRAKATTYLHLAEVEIYKAGAP
jgi:hypothetical protein